MLVRRVLSASITAALDQATLLATAASATRRAGIRNGVTVTTATAGGRSDAMRRDVGNLVGSVAAVSNGEVALVGSPDVAAKLQS